MHRCVAFLSLSLARRGREKVDKPEGSFFFVCQGAGSCVDGEGELNRKESGYQAITSQLIYIYIYT